MDLLAKLTARARANPRRVLLPESDDPRIIAAARQLTEEQSAIPILFRSCADALPGCEIFEDLPDASDWRDRAVEDFYLSRKHRGVDLASAKAALNSPLTLAAVLLKLGYADVAVAGAACPTADVLRAGLVGLGTAPGCLLVSSCFLMIWPDRVLTFADCAVNPEPNAKQLAQIAIDSAFSHERLVGEIPRIAMLSFSTLGSAQHPAVEKVSTAAKLVRTMEPTRIVDGELQFDAALDSGVAALKAPNSAVAGQANVFVFPSLEAANIGYKIAQRLGGAKAIGPFLQGFAKPWMDLSRGCSRTDIVSLSAIASLLAE